jgi:hypothetical protein
MRESMPNTLLIYTIKEVRQQTLVNRAWDHAWQTENREQPAITSNRCHPR